LQGNNYYGLIEKWFFEQKFLLSCLTGVWGSIIIAARWIKVGGGCELL
jgi:hypothetical protein